MESLRSRRWWARVAWPWPSSRSSCCWSFAGRRGLWLVLLTAAAAVVVVAAGFWFLQQRGSLRWLALALAVAAPVAVLVRLRRRPAALGGRAGRRAAGRGGARPPRTALRPDRVGVGVAGRRRRRPPQRPFLVMNPRSGGGKVARFDLQQRAEALGAEVALLDRPGTDVQQLARDALARGADLLGVAGGDGTQALVAQVAAEHDVPFLVISAGTRNHFALDLGLDREDPARCLDALRDGVEARIDLGDINGRPFVNNASFGAYAEIVESPAYRDDKRGTTLDAAARSAQRPSRRPPGGRRRRAGRRRAAGAAGQQQPLRGVRPRRDGPAGPPGPRRARGRRGPGGHRAAGGRAAQRRAPAGAAPRRRRARSWSTPTTPTVPVGIDGETVQLTTPGAVHGPARCAAGAPAPRPAGVRPPQGRLDWASLWGLAVGRSTSGRPSRRR